MSEFYTADFKKFSFFTFGLWILLSLLPNTTVFSQTTSVSFTTPGINTWTVPAGVTSITVEAWGGGGAGGGYNSVADAGAGGGGGGGAYTKATNVAVTPGNTYNVVVGAGGVGIEDNGPAGGNSYFNVNTAVAGGGNGGQGRTYPTGYWSGYGGTGGTGTYTGGKGADGVYSTRVSGGEEVVPVLLLAALTHLELMVEQ